VKQGVGRRIVSPHSFVESLAWRPGRHSRQVGRAGRALRIADQASAAERLSGWVEHADSACCVVRGTRALCRGDLRVVPAFS